MNRTWWTEERLTGGLLVAPILIALLAVAIMVIRGAVAGFRPAIGDSLREVAPYADTFDLLILLFLLAWVIHLLGAGLLARLIARAGGEQLAILAFTLVLVTVVTALIKFGFDRSVELWAAEEVVQAGALPSLFEALQLWTSELFRIGYRLHFIAMLAVGWAILRTNLATSVIGWATIAWSAFWLLAALAGAGAPAIPLLMPAAIGIAMMFHGTAKTRRNSTEDWK